jgi:hypothetical protein
VASVAAQLFFYSYMFCYNHFEKKKKSAFAAAPAAVVKCAEEAVVLNHTEH